MKDQVEGNIHDLKGNVKQKAGRLTNDPRLEAKGQAEKIAGKVQKKIGQMKRVVGK
ncbi:MAG: CsbD family protein [Candidatus Acidiferrales bacterium]